MTQDFNPTDLDRKLETSSERDYVKMVWDIYVPHKFTKFILLKDNFIELSQPHITIKNDYDDDNNNNNHNNDNNNINFDDSNDDDNNVGREELLCRYNDISSPLFRDIPPSPPLLLKRPVIEKDYDNTFLPPQTPTPEALKIDFDRPITNPTDKPNNIIEMVARNEKQDLDKYNLHLSEQLSKLFPEVEDGGGGGYLGQEDDQKINKLLISELTESLPKIDKGDVSKQLELFKGGQNKEFEDKVKLIGLSTDSIRFLEFLQSDFCQEIFIENKLKIHIQTGNIFFYNLRTNESIYGFFQQQENQSKTKINFAFSFTVCYEDHFDWLFHGFKGNYDVLTNKNSKYLFYWFNDYLERLLQPIKPVRHSIITDDHLALEVIQNENWQYFIETILTACKTNNGGINNTI